VDIGLSDGSYARGAVPSGASTGTSVCLCSVPERLLGLLDLGVSRGFDAFVGCWGIITVLRHIELARTVVLLLDLIDAYILVLSLESVLRRHDQRLFGTFLFFLLRESKYSLGRVYKNHLIV